MKVYEVGTFEKYEEGFHTFYRTLNKSKALFILEKTKEYLAKIPKIEFNASDEEYESHMKICASIDSEFKCATGLNFSLSGYADGFYEIQMHGFDLD